MPAKIQIDPYLPDDETEGIELPDPPQGEEFVTPAMLKGAVSAERVVVIEGDTFRERDTVCIVPTRGKIHWAAVAAWNNMFSPANSRKSVLFAVGHEVGRAYEAVVEYAVNDPVLRRWPYILTLEDDTLPPRDAHLRLVEAMEQHPEYVAIGALYHSKGELRFPMAFGDPERYETIGELDFLPREEASKSRDLIEVNGVAMGCTMWRTSIFREMPRPWFRTEQQFDRESGAKMMTQDLYFCRALREKGHRVAVHCGIRCGHLDVATGVVS